MNFLTSLLKKAYVVMLTFLVSLSFGQNNSNCLTTTKANLTLEANGQAVLGSSQVYASVFYEDFTSDAPGYSTTLNNWNFITNGGVDIGDYITGNASREIDLAGNNNSKISSKQTLNLSPGEYRLTFDNRLNNNPSGGNSVKATLGNFVFETSVSEITVRHEVFSFTVSTPTSAALVLEQLGTNDAAGSFIGNIQLAKKIDAYSLVTAVDKKCEVASLSVDKSTFYCSDTGINNVQLTTHYTDGSTSTTNVTVSVTDNILPVIACPFDITIDAQPGSCGAIVTYNQPTATDNCGSGNLPTSLDGHTFKGEFRGHTYFLSNKMVTPEQAHANAIAAGGHLATISDAAENTFISNFNSGFMWIGATDRDVEGQWKWITNEPYTYTNWAPGEPNNAGDGEDWAVINWGGTNPSWNDWYFTASAFYTVEFDGGTLPTTLVSGIESGGFFPVGTTEVTYEAVDASGNRVQCAFNVTVNDHEAPQVLTKNITAELDSAGNATITPQMIDNGSNDACGIASMNVSPSTFTCDNVGDNTVTLTVTDNNGNTSSANVVVSVVDNIAPLVLDNVDVSVNNAPGVCGAVVDYDLPSASDNCARGGQGQDVLLIWDVINSNTTALQTALTDAGLNVTLSATSETSYNGNNPSPDGFDAVIHLDGATYWTPMPVAGQQALVDYVLQDGGTYITQEWSAYEVDQTGGMNTMREIVVLQRRGGTQGNYTYTTVPGKENDPILDGLPNSFVVTGGHNIGAARFFNQNPSRVLMTADNGVGDAVVVRDFDNGGAAIGFAHACNYNNYPTLSIPEVQQLYVNSVRYAGGGGGGVSATQTTGLPSGSQFPVGTTTNTFEFTDDAGNTTTSSFDITVSDNEVPQITAPADIELLATSASGVVVNYDTPVGTDNCDVSTVLTSGLASGATFPIGVTTVTYTATDASGNSSSASFNVTVTGLPPVIELPEDITVSTDAGQCGAIVNYQAYDNTGIPASNITYDIQPGTFFGTGTTTVTATATNAVGSSSGTFTVTVVDNEAPLVVTQDLTVQLDASGNASIIASQIDNGSSDACGVANIAIDVTAFDCSNVGANIVTLTVTDVNGNSSTAIANVTVEDHVAPVAISQDITVQLDATGNISITAEAIDNGSSDACGIASLTLDQYDFDCSNLGDNKVGLTVTDVNGNSTEVAATVTVVDDLAPVVVTQDVSVILSNGQASITTSQVDGGTSDNCSFDLSLDNTTFNCNDIGWHVVTLTAVDSSGNTATATANVEVVGEVPTVSIADFTAVNTQQINTVFLGYGPQSVALQTTTTGGASFDYYWTSSSGEQVDAVANPVVSPEVSTTYYVEVTNNYGCTTSASFEVCVIDARSFNKKGQPDGKVLVCHHTHGKKGTKTVVISVSPNAVATHLNRHGDTLGACNASCVTESDNSSARGAGTNDSLADSKLTVYPNPSRDGLFNIRLDQDLFTSNKPVDRMIYLYDLSGKVVDQKTILAHNNSQVISIGKANLSSGFYMLRIVSGDEVITEKLIVE